MIRVFVESFMSETQPREFVGGSVAAVTLAGRDLQVSPLTMGQLHQLKVFFRTLPRPEPVAVEVLGLVEAMLRPSGPENGHGPADGPGRLFQRLTSPVEIRKEIRDTVLQAVREARGRQEQWPPDPTSPLGQEVILTDPDVQVEFARIVLAKHQPDLTAEEVGTLVRDADVVEYMDFVEAAFATVRKREQTQARDNLRMLGEMAEDPKLRPLVEAQMGRMFPDGSNSGGDVALSPTLPSRTQSTGLTSLPG
jgi:hypothetical protein